MAVNPCGVRCETKNQQQLNCVVPPTNPVLPSGSRAYAPYPGGSQDIYSPILSPLNGHSYVPYQFSVSVQLTQWAPYPINGTYQNINNAFMGENWPRNNPVEGYPRGWALYPTNAGSTIVETNKWQSEVVGVEGVREYYWTLEFFESPYRYVVTLTHLKHPDPGYPTTLVWEGNEDNTVGNDITLGIKLDNLRQEDVSRFNKSIPCMINVKGINWGCKQDGVRGAFRGTRTNRAEGHIHTRWYSESTMGWYRWLGMFGIPAFFDYSLYPTEAPINVGPIPPTGRAVHSSVLDFDEDVVYYSKARCYTPNGIIIANRECYNYDIWPQQTYQFTEPSGAKRYFGPNAPYSFNFTDTPYAPGQFSQNRFEAGSSLQWYNAGSWSLEGGYSKFVEYKVQDYGDTIYNGGTFQVGYSLETKTTEATITNLHYVEEPFDVGPALYCR